MKTIFVILLLLIFQNVYPQTGELSIIITGVKPVIGNINLGLYNNASDFPKEEKEYKNIIFKADSSVVSYSLEIPQGEYAIAVFHDKNADDKCNRSLLGFPTEGYGFSNNVRPRFSAPSFEKTKFNVGESKTITIALIY